MDPKILFTSPCGPYPKLPVSRDPLDHFYYRNTYKQKLFKLRSFQSWHSLHFIAQNIQVPSVVLENPTTKRFREEVNRCNYEIVAIGFTVFMTKRVLEMVEWLKTHNPSIEIILGGYGTAVFKDSFVTSDKLKSMADHICYGEGVGFVDKIIEKKWNIKNNEKLSQDLLPSRNSFFRTKLNLFSQIILVQGLGCNYSCPFCSTSAQFSHRYLPLFTYQELFICLQQQTAKHPRIRSVIIYNEDFLANRTEVLKFAELFMESGMMEKGILLTVFASARSVLNFSIKELTGCGIGTIFIGVESFNENIIGQEGLLKREGNIKELFRELHDHGINTLGSLIVGWDGHTEETVNDDAKRFVELNPTFYQVVPLHIAPGTRLWDEMRSDGRIPADFSFDNDSVFSFNFKEKNFPHNNAIGLIDSVYKELVKHGGPWPFRLFENLIKGYTKLKDKNEAVFMARARIYKSMMFPLCLTAFSSIVFFGGREFRKRWFVTFKNFYKQFPILFGTSLFLSPLAVLFLSLIYLTGLFFYILSKNGDQPDFVRRVYHQN